MEMKLDFHVRLSTDEISMETQLQIDYDFVYVNFNQFINELNVMLFLFFGKTTIFICEWKKLVIKNSMKLFHALHFVSL